jgi:hypothetical protein
LSGNEVIDNRFNDFATRELSFGLFDSDASDIRDEEGNEKLD